MPYLICWSIDWLYGVYALCTLEFEVDIDLLLLDAVLIVPLVNINPVD